jgi:hypothetical protein
MHNNQKNNIILKQIALLQKFYLESGNDNNDKKSQNNKIRNLVVNYFINYTEIHYDKFSNISESYCYFIKLLQKIYRYNTYISYISSLENFLFEAKNNIKDFDIEIGNIAAQSVNYDVVNNNKKELDEEKIAQIFNFPEYNLEDKRDKIILRLIILYSLSAFQIAKIGIFDIVKQGNIVKIFIPSKARKERIKFITIDGDFSRQIISYLNEINKEMKDKNINLIDNQSFFVSFSYRNLYKSICERTINRIIVKRSLQTDLAQYDLNINKIKGRIAMSISTAPSKK